MMKLEIIRKAAATYHRYMVAPLQRALWISSAVLLLVSIVVPAPRVDATSSGVRSPATGGDNTTSGIGTIAWSGTGNVISQNGTAATNSLTSNAVSHPLTATNFGFSIPSTATIDGVTATIWRSATSSTKGAVQDNAVRLVVGGVVQTTDRAVAGVTWPTTNTSQTYGGSTDVWGATLTPATINASTFGVAISAIDAKISGGGASLTASVDYISVTVDYTLATVYNQASYRMYGNADNPASTATFATRVDYDANNGTTRTLAVADFNGDGKLDVASNINQTGYGLSIRMNNGDGTFAARVNYSAASNQVPSVAAADLNGDNKPDLAATEEGTDTVDVFMNNGDGTFAASVNYQAGTFANAVAAADLNGDNKPDLTVLNGNSKSVSIFMNNGDGTFATKVDYPTGTFASAVAAADLNGDNKPDLAISEEGSNSVSIFMNNGDGTFATKVDYPTGTSPQAVAAADLNGDGKPDLAVGTGMSGSVSVFINNGNGTFGSNTDYVTASSDVRAIALADTNGDGKNDMLVGGSNYPLAVFSNTTTVSADVGSPLAGLSTAATVVGGQTFRMRMDVGVSTTPVASGGLSLKLQYAPMNVSCDTAFVNTTAASYTDVTNTSTVGYHTNTYPANGAALAVNAYDPTDGSNTLVRQTYQQTGTTNFSNASAIPVGQDGMWDFALTTNNAPVASSYCLRLVKSTGAQFDSYTVIPKITTASANSAPNSPTSLAQKTTADAAIPTGNWTNSSNVKFTASATDPDSSDTLALCVEKKPLGAAFTNTEDACGTAVGYSGAAVTPSVTLGSISANTQYHWQARLKDAAGSYSGWISFGGNAESAADFGVDTTVPSVGTVYDGTAAGVDASFNTGSLSSLSANWSGFGDSGGSGLARYDYAIGTTPGGTDIVNWTSNALTTSATVNSLVLQTTKVYYVSVRAVDSAGNVSSAVSSDGQLVSPTLTFGVAPSSTTFNNLNAGNSYTDSQTTTLTTSTNAYGGYLIKAFATGTLASGARTIPDFSAGSYASPNSWQSGDTGYGYTSSDTTIQGINKFQAATCQGGRALVAPGCFAPFTHSGPGDIIADHTTNVSGAPVSNEQFTITSRITSAATQAAGSYQTTVVYTIVPLY